ncbi:hypothetical protein CALCODRAFT_295452 [Calocera cornea HHB12733]|uniref:AN1-type domain-containing protein n=1 Tax=Calocera cornea HHB12733 TaxID=1353952 RepID=A0A165FP98_9BASI|nr:hypothetical protein CALCODRAFT_295452 [Calocera cornea HHB12733]
MDAAGTLCSYPSCHLHDFLPIPCPGCHQLFCRDHALPHEHGCASLATLSTANASQYVAARRCDLSGCSQKAMLGNIHAEGEDAVVKCQACKGAFCVTHRVPSSHACSSTTATAAPTAPSRAQQLLARNFPSSSAPTAPKTTAARRLPTDPAKLKQYLAVQVMKMRHSAKPADDKDAKMTLAVGDKLHVRVRVVGENPKDEILWFRKTTPAGRALDMLASRFKLPHEPGSSDPTRTLSLAVPGTDAEAQETSTTLDLNKPLDGQVPDGGELWLVRRS